MIYYNIRVYGRQMAKLLKKIQFNTIFSLHKVFPQNLVEVRLVFLVVFLLYALIFMNTDD